MRSLSESRQRWAETSRSSSSIAALQQAIKLGGTASPCESGLRSVCWKIFLLFRNALPEDRLSILSEARADYGMLCERYLQFIKHPERLAELTVDPLADDPESPWDTFRRDDIVRSEILQDVRRLPDEPFYHQEHIQTLILDVLFVYCKHHPDAGGYRQGMHELLAPIVYVLGQDAISEAEAEAGPPDASDASDASMKAMLDVRYMAHDSFALFSAVMDRAQGFYELSSCSGQPSRSSRSSSSSSSSSSRSSDSTKKKRKTVLPRDILLTGAAGLYTSPSLGRSADVVERSAIVEMSKAIHEGTLMKIDPELAVHLKTAEVLPQIFLIRWIRLLFGREFPFDQQLVLWDSIFAFDPDLDLVPFICVAMLLRIRWELLEADYSVALQLLLKYPPPPPPHGPYTFVDDALFLRDHFSIEGGASLVLKYSGRAPAKQRQQQQQQQQATSPSRSSSATGTSATTAASTSQPSTPNSVLAAGLDSLRNRTRMAVRSPLRALSPDAGASADADARQEQTTVTSPLTTARHGPSTALSPSRFAHGREGVEALLHGAAKGAKGVMERGEKLGLNQAVRDAVGDFRRSMIQGLQEARQQAAKAKAARGEGGGWGAASGNGNSLLGASSFLYARGRTGGAGGGGMDSEGQVLQVLAEMERMEQRNRQLAAMLSETVDSLRSLVAAPSPSSTSSGLPTSSASSSAAAEEGGGGGGGGPEEKDAVVATTTTTTDAEAVQGGRRQQWLDVVELAAAKVQFVKVHLEDASLALALPPDEDQSQAQSTATSERPGDGASGPGKAEDADRHNKDSEQGTQDEPKAKTAETAETAEETKPGSAANTTTTAAPAEKKEHTIPSRSTLAQSSFAWMLEPGDTPDGSAASSLPDGSSSASSARKRRAPRASPASRGRHAFLFGDVVSTSPLGGGEEDDGDDGDDVAGVDRRNPPMGGGGRKWSVVTADEVFGLELLRRRPPAKD